MNEFCVRGIENDQWMIYLLFYHPAHLLLRQLLCSFLLTALIDIQNISA